MASIENTGGLVVRLIEHGYALPFGQRLSLYGHRHAAWMQLRLCESR